MDVGAPSVTFGEGHESGADEHKDAGGEHDDMKSVVGKDGSPLPQAFSQADPDLERGGAVGPAFSSAAAERTERQR